MFQTRAVGLFSFPHINWWFFPFALTSVTTMNCEKWPVKRFGRAHIALWATQSQSKMTSCEVKWVEKILLCFPTSFLCLSHPSVVLFFTVGSEEENNPHVWPSSGNGGVRWELKTEGSSGPLNKQICIMIHELTEAALSIDDCKHPKGMFLKRSETSILWNGVLYFPYL